MCLTIEELKTLLDFPDNKPYEVANEILNLLEGNEGIVLSRTGDNEILIYRAHNKNYYNILIDEDSDVSYLFIGDKREDTYCYMLEDKNYGRVINDILTNR